MKAIIIGNGLAGTMAAKTLRDEQQGLRDAAIHRQETLARASSTLFRSARELSRGLPRAIFNPGVS